MTGHISYRLCGAASWPGETKPFRKTDLTGREELAQVRKELAKLESHARGTTQETLDNFPDLHRERNQRIEELKRRSVNWTLYGMTPQPPQPRHHPRQALQPWPSLTQRTRSTTGASSYGQQHP